RSMTFVPRWLNISSPQSAKSPVVTFEKHGQHLSLGEGRFRVSESGHNSFNNGSSWHWSSLLLYYSVGSGLTKGGAYAGITGSPPGWHGCSPGHDSMSQHGRGEAGNHPHWNSSIHAYSQEKPPTERRKEKEEDKMEKVKFRQKCFPSLNPEAGKHQPCRPAGTPSRVWKSPPSAKQHSKVLVIKKVSKEDPAAAFSAALTSPGSHRVNRNKSSATLPSVYRNLVPKPEPPPSKLSAWKTNRMACSSGSLCSSRKSVLTSLISVSKPVALGLGTVLSSPKERPSGTTLPYLETSASHLTKLTCLKNKWNGDFSENRGRDKLEDLENNSTPKPKNREALALPVVQEGKVLSHSAMGWQEYQENDEDCLPLAEDELKELHMKTEQLRRNSFEKSSFLQGRSSSMFSPWKSTPEVEDSETRGTETSDDEAWK
uniref:Uncharacterized protein n=1 Tax=Loxodonta africana TaxID=9785 RepID=G3UBA8_LOXAF